MFVHKYITPILVDNHMETIVFNLPVLDGNTSTQEVMIKIKIQPSVERRWSCKNEEFLGCHHQDFLQNKVKK